jgi:hypothetical protein
MSTYEKIIQYMTEKLPEECTLVDGPTTYTSTQQAHRSLARYLTTANPGTSVHRTYAVKAFNWLKLLHKNNINLQNTNK